MDSQQFRELVSLRNRLGRRGFLRLAATLGLSSGVVAMVNACAAPQPAAPAGPGPAPAPAPASSPAAAPPPAAPPAAPSPAAAAPAPAASPAASGAGPANAVRGGTFKLPVTANITTWPPIGQIQNLMVHKALFGQLVRPGKDLTPQPDLAESWTVSQDGLVWTLKLRQGVTWHDGQPFTADDVLFSLNDVYKNKDVRGIFQTSLAPIVKIEAPDPHTVRLTTEQPLSSLLELLSYLIFMLPKHLLQGKDLNDPQEFLQKPIGTGPFKFQEHQRGQFLALTAFDTYYAGRPYLDGVLFKIIPDVNNTVAQVRTGELDIAFIGGQHLDALRGANNVRIDEAYQLDLRFFGFNYKHPRVGDWFQDKRVRQAFAYAIDRKGIMEEVTGGKGVVSNGPIPSFFQKWYNPNALTYPYDPAKAKALLAEAGWTPGPDGILTKNGERFSVTTNLDKGQPDREQTALLVQQQLKQVGVEINLNVLEFTVYMDHARNKKDFETVCFYYVTPNTPDLISYWSCGGGTNEWGYCNPEVDTLFKQAQTVFEDAKRKEVYDRVYALLAEDQPAVFIYHPLELRAINTKVQNFPKIGYRDALLYLNEVWIER